VSGLDKKLTNAFYEIEIDRQTSLPVKIRLTVLSGQRGKTLAKGQKIVGGEHVAFHFEYSLSEFNEVKPPEIPADAQKLLASR
jgi:hypothetical protein